MKLIRIYLLLFLPTSLFGQTHSIHTTLGVFTQAKLSKHVSGAPSSINTSLGYVYSLSKYIGLNANVDYSFARSSTLSTSLPNAVNPSSPFETNIHRGYKASIVHFNLGGEVRIKLDNQNLVGLHAALGLARLSYQESVKVIIKNQGDILLFEGSDYYPFESKMLPMLRLGFVVGHELKEGLDLEFGLKYSSSISKKNNFELSRRAENPLSSFPTQVDKVALSIERSTIGEMHKPVFFALTVGLRYALSQKNKIEMFIGKYP